MNSKTTKNFRKLLVALPHEVRAQARKAYRQFNQNPSLPSLHFKQVHPNIPIYSVRITKDYRAVGQKNKNRIVWFWIGSHSNYDKLLSQL